MNKDSSFVIHDHPYFTLPLAALPALRDSGDPAELANLLIDLALDRMADHFRTKFPPSMMEGIKCAETGESVAHWRRANNCPRPRPVPDCAEDENNARSHIALACMALKVSTESLEGIEDRAGICRRRISRFDYKSNVIFSIQTRDLWSLTEGEMPLDDFLVLAAIRSILGIDAKNKPPRRITREQIAARMGGYSRVKDIHPNRRKMLLNEPNLKRIGRRADKLAKQERFTRWTVFKRETYYHVSMTESQIADFVTEKKSKPVHKRIVGLKAEVESRTKLEAIRQQEADLKETLSRMK